MVILWRIFEGCNFSCAFCAFSREIERPRRRTDAAEVRRMIEIFAEFRRQRDERVLLSWLGGEPFLRRDLPELTRLAASRGLAVSTTTNGSALGAARVREHVLADYAELTVSIDGLEDFHDAVRAAPGSFDAIKRALCRLVEERGCRAEPLLRVNSVLMRDSVRSFPALALELASWGIDEISVNQLGGVDRPDFHRRQRLLPEDVSFIESELPRLREELCARGVRLLGGAEYWARMRASARGESLCVADCAPGERFLFIDEFGRISPCSFTPNELGFPITEILSVADFADVSRRFRLARALGPASACGDCKSTQIFAKFATR